MFIPESPLQGVLNLCKNLRSDNKSFLVQLKVEGAFTFFASSGGDMKATEDGWRGPGRGQSHERRKLRRFIETEMCEGGLWAGRWSRGLSWGEHSEFSLGIGIWSWKATTFLQGEISQQYDRDYKTVWNDFGILPKRKPGGIGKRSRNRRKNPMTRKYEAWHRYSLDKGLLQLLGQLSLYKPWLILAFVF